VPGPASSTHGPVREDGVIETSAIHGACVTLFSPDDVTSQALPGPSPSGH
jgi:hypothetical protein